MRDHVTNFISRRTLRVPLGSRVATDQPKRQMALLVDKHRPRSLDALTYHKDLSERLRSLVRAALSQLLISTNII